MNALAAKTLKTTKRYQQFKTAGTEGITGCEIRSIILPLLAGHVPREEKEEARCNTCNVAGGRGTDFMEYADLLEGKNILQFAGAKKSYRPVSGKLVSVPLSRDIRAERKRLFFMGRPIFKCGIHWTESF